MAGITTKTSGPIFNGRLLHSISLAAEEAEREIAQAGVNMVRGELAAVLRHPTGYYESQIQTDRRFNNSLVTDGGVIYGPWLDGSGSRNQTTRFKGYAHWRRATQRLQARAGSIADDVVDRRIRGL